MFLEPNPRANNTLQMDSLLRGDFILLPQGQSPLLNPAIVILTPENPALSPSLRDIMLPQIDRTSSGSATDIGGTGASANALTPIRRSWTAEISERTNSAVTWATSR